MTVEHVPDVPVKIVEKINYDVVRQRVHLG